MNLDSAFHLAGSVCLIGMAVLAAIVIVGDIRRNLPKIVAALCRAPAAPGDPTPRVTAGHPLDASGADVDQPAPLRARGAS